MSNKQSIAAVLGILLIILGYNKDKITPTPTPDNQVIVEIEAEVFPTEPSQELQKTVQDLDNIITDYKDALVLARAFRDWGDRVNRPTKMTNLGEFQQAYKNSLQELVYKTSMEGKYKGKLAVTFDKIIDSQLQYLFDGKGNIQSLELTPQVIKSLQDSMYAISWKLALIWEQLLVEDSNETPA